MYCIDPRRFITRKEIQYFIWHYFANFQNSRFSISNNLFCCKNTKGFSQNKSKALDQTNITQKMYHYINRSQKASYMLWKMTTKKIYFVNHKSNSALSSKNLDKFILFRPKHLVFRYQLCLKQTFLEHFFLKSSKLYPVRTAHLVAHWLKEQ